MRDMVHGLGPALLAHLEALGGTLLPGTRVR